jgi:hypothetical protein
MMPYSGTIKTNNRENTKIRWRPNVSKMRRRKKLKS